MLGRFKSVCVKVKILHVEVPAVAASAAEAGVLVVPGAGFMTDPETISRSFRLNYSTPSDEAILRGMEILGRLTHSL